jgi:AcrR family transcriptional regulator
VTVSVERQAPRRRRSEALTADERRAEILQAVMPLLAVRGPLVTSAEMAEAADVAQGTIFHVFGDKQAVIDAAVRSAFDLQPLVDEIQALVAERDLVTRLGAAIDLICARLTTALPLIMKCGGSKPEFEGGEHPMVKMRVALTALLQPDAASLSHPPQQLGAMLFGLCMAAAHQSLLEEQAMPKGAEIAALFLDGARRRTRTRSSPR